MNKNFVLIALAACVSLPTMAQRRGPSKTPAPATTDTAKPRGPANLMQQGGPKAGPKAYNEVITNKAKTTEGLFIVHKIEDKTFFEIPDSILGRDIMIVTRMAKAGVDMRGAGSMSGYAGDQLNNSVVRFEKGPNNRIFMRDLSYSERSSDSTQPMFKTVMNSNIQPIALAFDVKAYRTKDSTADKAGSVIEMTDLINSDNDIFFFGNAKGAFKVGAYQADKSYPLDVLTFPINTEIKTVKTYMRAAGNNPLAAMMGGGGASGPVTVELNTSMVLLPKVPMKSRYADGRVGYFTHGYTDFDKNPQGVKQISQIARWRLEPKDEDIEKYKRGELVEPKKPIIIYIDPATPAKWVPYLIQGVDDWNIAFEKAGFKNAIFGKRAPTPQEDPTWTLDDARNSAIVYKPSSVPNASGPHVADPRSGEIMETHINWYHNVMKLIHDWYMVQTAAVDPKARKMQFDDELMGQLIRFVSSHEVGHTLGLRHNFGSSAATPVEKLRDKAWVEKHGHTSSIMDYARFNYVAQPEDNISQAGLFPRIGDYDIWAIEWGYRWIPEASSPEEELPILNKWVMEKAKDKRYWFGHEMSADDPRAQSEDLGDNAMKASEYGIKNLKRIVPNLVEWTREDNDGYGNLSAIYGQITTQLGRYIGHVSKNIGGRYENLKAVEQAGAVYELVPAATQKEAVEFLNKQIFNTPTWIIDPKVLSLTGGSPVSIITSLQENALGKLVSAGTFTKLVNAEASDAKAYKVTDFIKDVQKGIWGELDSKEKISIYRRNLQKSYVSKMTSIVKPGAAAAAPTGLPAGFSMSGGGGSSNSDAVAVAKASLVTLKAKIKATIPAMQDDMSRYHLQDLLDKITTALSTKD